METKQLLSEGDIMHIRMLLREEKDNGYAATVINRLNATEEALKNSAQLVDCRLIGRRPNLLRTGKKREKHLRTLPVRIGKNGEVKAL